MSILLRLLEVLVLERIHEQALMAWQSGHVGFDALDTDQLWQLLQRASLPKSLICWPLFAPFDPATLWIALLDAFEVLAPRLHRLLREMLLDAGVVVDPSYHGSGRDRFAVAVL